MLASKSSSYWVLPSKIISHYREPMKRPAIPRATRKTYSREDRVVTRSLTAPKRKREEAEQLQQDAEQWYYRPIRGLRYSDHIETSGKFLFLQPSGISTRWARGVIQHGRAKPDVQAVDTSDRGGNTAGSGVTPGDAEAFQSSGMDLD